MYVDCTIQRQLEGRCAKIWSQAGAAAMPMHSITCTVYHPTATPSTFWRLGSDSMRRTFLGTKSIPSPTKNKMCMRMHLIDLNHPPAVRRRGHFTDVRCGGYRRDTHAHARHKPAENHAAGSCTHKACSDAQSSKREACHGAYRLLWP